MCSNKLIMCHCLHESEDNLHNVLMTSGLLHVSDMTYAFFHIPFQESNTVPFIQVGRVGGRSVGGGWGRKLEWLLILDKFGSPVFQQDLSNSSCTRLCRL